MILMISILREGLEPGCGLLIKYYIKIVSLNKYIITYDWEFHVQLHSKEISDALGN